MDSDRIGPCSPKSLIFVKLFKEDVVHIIICLPFKVESIQIIAMEDKVPFKVYTYWKDQSKPEVRRFGIEKSVVTSFCYLDAKLQDVYPGLKNKHYIVFWKDEEDDEVIISSDDEMMTALSAMNDNLMKIFVNCKNERPKEIECNVVITATNDSTVDNNLPHCGVICDICDAPVVGFRYKCTSCADYDLCSKCEAAGHHAEHIMVRVPIPNMPRTTIRAAIRRSRHIMKSVATAMAETECHYKRPKGEKIAEKKRHHAHHGEGSRGDQHRRPRPSWLETFATYMNEFANLAGDVGTEAGRNRDSEPRNVKNGSQEQSKESGNAQAAPKQPEPSSSGAENIQCPFPSSANQESVQKLVKMVYGVDISQLLSQVPFSHVGNEENKQESNQQPESDEGSVKSEVSSTVRDGNNSTKKDISPERLNDDWTMINNEKDIMDTDVKPSAPNDQAVGFNLPEEFQERVTINDGQSLYPPLHTASAEPEKQIAQQEQQTNTNGKGPMSEPVKQKISPTATQFQPQPPQPTPCYHSEPHIDAAITQMMAMGFTNDGGWLTRLLENADGNIAAVIELLTPISPKK
ncbi:unnamed protein product, partial [Iphiclides podalirius]